MATHYATVAKARAHRFMLDEIDRHGITVKRMMTLPSAEALCVLAVRAHQGEKIVTDAVPGDEDGEWLEAAPQVPEPRLHAFGIERQKAIVIRSTLIRRGILQEFAIGNVAALNAPSVSLLRQGQRSGDEMPTSVLWEPNAAEIGKFNLIYLDYTIPCTKEMAEEVASVVRRYLTEGGLVVVTTQARAGPSPTDRLPAGDVRQHRYVNAKCRMAATSWRKT